MYISGHLAECGSLSCAVVYAGCITFVVTWRLGLVMARHQKAIGHTLALLRLCVQGLSQWTEKVCLNSQLETSQIQLLLQCLFCEWEVGRL